MSPVLPTFVAQSGREAAFIISTRTEGDNWDWRHESLRFVPTPNIERYLLILKRAITYLNGGITGFQGRTLTLAHLDESDMQNYRRFG